jgi:hypothetical protein
MWKGVLGLSDGYLFGKSKKSNPGRFSYPNVRGVYFSTRYNMLIGAGTAREFISPLDTICWSDLECQGSLFLHWMQYADRTWNVKGVDFSTGYNMLIGPGMSREFISPLDTICWSELEQQGSLFLHWIQYADRSWNSKGVYFSTGYNMLIGPGMSREFISPLDTICWSDLERKGSLQKQSCSSSISYTLNVFIKYVLNVGNISFKMYNCLFLYRFIFLRYILVAK